MKIRAPFGRHRPDENADVGEIGRSVRSQRKFPAAVVMIADMSSLGSGGRCVGSKYRAASRRTRLGENIARCLHGQAISGICQQDCSPGRSRESPRYWSRLPLIIRKQSVLPEMSGEGALPYKSIDPKTLNQEPKLDCSCVLYSGTRRKTVCLFAFRTIVRIETSHRSTGGRESGNLWKSFRGRPPAEKGQSSQPPTDRHNNRKSKLNSSEKRQNLSDRHSITDQKE